MTATGVPPWARICEQVNEVRSDLAIVGGDMMKRYDDLAHRLDGVAATIMDRFDALPAQVVNRVTENYEFAGVRPPTLQELSALVSSSAQSNAEIMKQMFESHTEYLRQCFASAVPQSTNSEDTNGDNTHVAELDV